MRYYFYYLPSQSWHLVDYYHLFFYHITLKFLWCSNQRSFIICFW